MNLSKDELEHLWEIFPIIFVDNNPKFVEQYCEEELKLKKLLGNYIIRISHIGSTSIKKN